MIYSIITKLAANPKRLFLLDGLGALLTAIMLGLALPSLPTWFGMPIMVLHTLAGLACLFSLYSICCAMLLSVSFRSYLLLIILANFAYCCLTFSLVCYYYGSLATLGIIYFLLEITVIILLIIIELAVYKRLL